MVDLSIVTLVYQRVIIPLNGHYWIVSPIISCPPSLKAKVSGPPSDASAVLASSRHNWPFSVLQKRPVSEPLKRKPRGFAICSSFQSHGDIRDTKKQVTIHRKFPKSWGYPNKTMVVLIQSHGLWRLDDLDYPYWPQVDVLVEPQEQVQRCKKRAAVYSMGRLTKK